MNMNIKGDFQICISVPLSMFDCFVTTRIKGLKHDLNLRRSHWNSSLNKVFLEILQISQENTCVEVSF